MTFLKEILLANELYTFNTVVFVAASKHLNLDSIKTCLGYRCNDWERKRYWLQKSITTGTSSKRNKRSILRRTGGMEARALSCLYEKNQYAREAQVVEPTVGRRHGPLMTRFFFFSLFFMIKGRLMGRGLSVQVLEI